MYVYAHKRIHRILSTYKCVCVSACKCKCKCIWYTFYMSTLIVGLLYWSLMAKTGEIKIYKHQTHISIRMCMCVYA